MESSPEFLVTRHCAIIQLGVGHLWIHGDVFILHRLERLSEEAPWLSGGCVVLFDIDMNGF